MHVRAMTIVVTLWCGVVWGDGDVSRVAERMPGGSNEYVIGGMSVTQVRYGQEFTVFRRVDEPVPGCVKVGVLQVSEVYGADASCLPRRRPRYATRLR